MWGERWAARGLSVEVLANSYLRFDSFKDDNVALDLGAKSLALRVSSTVVSLICHAGEELLSIGSGTIIECNADSGCFRATVLTSAILLRCPSGASAIPPDLKIGVYLSCEEVFQGQVLTFDFHYGVATIEIKSSVPLSTATINFINDSMDDVVAVHKPTSSFQLRDPATAVDRFNIRPGELVLALGRYFRSPYSIMAAPGAVLFREEDIVGFGCKELFTTGCTITKVGIGGPLINCRGEVIGINFLDYDRTVSLPMNIAFKCLENFKRNKLVPRPWLGLNVANLYNQSFPDIAKGVMVGEVKDGSPAKAAGLCVGDVIIKCGRVLVGTRLEFLESLWRREGKTVKMVVLRPSSGEKFKLSVTVERSPIENEWPVLDASRLPTL